MNNGSSENGYALVMLLAVLTIAGGTLYAAQVSHSASPTAQQALHAKRNLMSARQALLSYTTHYPYMYGPRGAGVGHFPCPDTDRGLDQDISAWSTRSGPNPPCGRLDASEGRLPAHVSYPTQRYMFDSGEGAPVRYRVSGEFINNPSNRVVNPTLLAREDTIAIAKLVKKMSVRSLASESVSMITPTALLLAIKPAVSIWFVDKLNKLETMNCFVRDPIGQNHDTDTDTDTDTPLTLPSRCEQLRQITSSCQQQSEYPVSMSGLFDPTGVDASVFLSRSSLSQLIVLLLADELPAAYNCDELAQSQLSIEQVPANTHWFVRNQWHFWIKFVAEDECFTAVDELCSMNSINRLSYANLAEPIFVQWRLP